MELAAIHPDERIDALAAAVIGAARSAASRRLDEPEFLDPFLIRELRRVPRELVDAVEQAVIRKLESADRTDRCGVGVACDSETFGLAAVAG